VGDDGTVLSDASLRRWNQRASAVVGAAFSGLAVPVSGLLDHFAGREWALPHAATAAVLAATVIHALEV
jgi:alcohol dehydrogenase class IV